LIPKTKASRASKATVASGNSFDASNAPDHLDAFVIDAPDHPDALDVRALDLLIFPQL
jgi:hypothetical protein